MSCASQHGIAMTLYTCVDKMPERPLTVLQQRARPRHVATFIIKRHINTAATSTLTLSSCRHACCFHHFNRNHHAGRERNTIAK